MTTIVNAGWILLAHLLVATTLTFLSLGQQTARFYHIKDPLSGPTRLDSGSKVVSRSACAIKCLKTNASTCKSFLYNKMTGLCRPGSTVLDTAPPPVVAEEDLYKGFYCDLSQSFQMKTSGSTQACVRVFTSRLNYTDADKDCRKRGAFLMSVKNEDKLAILFTFNLHRSSNIFVGADDIAVEDTFVWKEDGTVMTWAQRNLTMGYGEPNNYLGGENCISTYLNPSAPYSRYQRYQLADWNCSHTLYYACEMRLS